MASMIFRRLPNLETIDVEDFACVSTYPLIDHHLGHAKILQETNQYDDPLSMARLHRVSLRNSYNNDTVRHINAQSYLSLPSVKTVCADFFMERASISWTEPVEKTYPTKHLTLTGNPQYVNATLSEIRLLFPRVASLKLVFNEELYLFHEHGLVFSPREDYLESLTIITKSTIYSQNQFRISEHISRTEAALHGLNKLKRMDAPARALFNREGHWPEGSTNLIVRNESGQGTEYHSISIQNFFNGMPPFLEHLTIRDCTEAIDGVFTALLEDPSAPLTNLKTISLSIREGRVIEDIHLWVDRLACRRNIILRVISSS